MQSLHRDELRVLQQQRHRWDVSTGLAFRSRSDRFKGNCLALAASVGRFSGRPLCAALAVDVLIAVTGVANALNQDLAALDVPLDGQGADWDGVLADAVGRLADAAEKIDHLEPFTEQARSASRDIVTWLVAVEGVLGVNLSSLSLLTMRS